jgi:hypothetical protein
MSMTEYLTHNLKGFNGSVSILITKEQAEDPKFRRNLYQYYIGFLPRELVPSYECRSCRNKFDQPPKIEVRISGRDEDPIAFVLYSCNNCGEYICEQHLELAGGIDPKYIVFDETGDYRIPTTRDIEDRMQLALECAHKGGGMDLDSGEYERHVNQARRWAGKIGYIIPEDRIDELREVYRTSYLRNAEGELPETVERIKHMSHDFDLSHAEGVPISSYGRTELCDMIEGLYGVLPHIEIPDDPELRNDILRILNTRKRMLGDKVIDLVNESDENNKQINRGIAKIRDTDKFIKSYLDRTGMNESDIERAGELSL